MPVSSYLSKKHNFIVITIFKVLSKRACTDVFLQLYKVILLIVFNAVFLLDSHEKYISWRIDNAAVIDTKPSGLNKAEISFS